MPRLAVLMMPSPRRKKPSTVRACATNRNWPNAISNSWNYIGRERRTMRQDSTQSTLARWQTPLICLVLGVVTFAVYWAARRNEFLNWDDLTYVSINDHVRGGITWANIVWAFTHSYSSNWHPLTWISHMLDCQLFGLNPSPPHLVNVAFHIANVLLLFVFLRNATGALWRSAFVAALFALHPLHVESVAWLAERKDVLSTFFLLLSLIAYVRYVRRPAPVRYGLV